MLRELVDDEELWFYQPEMERCRIGDIFRVSEMPKITARPPDPSEPVRSHCKDLFVQKYGATVGFVRVELLAAVDPDTLEVYWCRA